MGCSQRRIGPLNLGSYGILPSIINGCNLIIPQLRVPKIHFHLGFHVFPLFFFSLMLFSFLIPYPFYFVDPFFSWIILILLSGLSIVLLILSAFSGCSKYSMLGCIRIVPSLVSLELI